MLIRIHLRLRCERKDDDVNRATCCGRGGYLALPSLTYLITGATPAPPLAIGVLPARPVVSSITRMSDQSSTAVALRQVGVAKSRLARRAPVQPWHSPTLSPAPVRTTLRQHVLAPRWRSRRVRPRELPMARMPHRVEADTVDTGSRSGCLEAATSDVAMCVRLADDRARHLFDRARGADGTRVEHDHGAPVRASVRSPTHRRGGQVSDGIARSVKSVAFAVRSACCSSAWLEVVVPSVFSACGRVVLLRRAKC